MSNVFCPITGNSDCKLYSCKISGCFLRDVVEKPARRQSAALADEEARRADMWGMEDA